MLHISFSTRVCFITETPLLMQKKGFKQGFVVVVVVFVEYTVAPLDFLRTREMLQSRSNPF